MKVKTLSFVITVRSVYIYIYIYIYIYTHTHKIIYLIYVCKDQYFKDLYLKTKNLMKLLGLNKTRQHTVSDTLES